MKRLLSLGIGATALLLAMSGCGLGDLTGGPQVGVTLDEYAVKLSQSSSSPGKVTFKVHNAGREKHEFVILRTDLDQAALPQEAGKIKEESTGIEHVDELDGVDAGKEKTLTVDLKPGTYLFVCNIPEHAHQGMVARFKIS
jgi:uncharacterized cupredoxin-like copper-binding protein